MGTFLPKAWLIFGLVVVLVKTIAMFPILEGGFERQIIAQVVDKFVIVLQVLTLSIIYSIFSRVSNNRMALMIGWGHLFTYSTAGVLGTIMVYLTQRGIVSEESLDLQTRAILFFISGIAGLLSTVCFFTVALLVAREAKSQFRPSDFD